ncbi:hypothetical protein COU77_04295 [Candidatus Peregrinibacteria bacterium CG10_big_fil_rev_8_21_14_0_10_49_16]|nr:MAG: hypothetical protein COU77_04295 [Candidatus Peregrinibacteria bacterium CG10_big_fil_rev_8_21_14_0_10_49_16]
MRITRIAPILGGFEYQHLISWYIILGLKKDSEQIEQVVVENNSAGSCDDITVFHKQGSGRPNCFYQVKYHTDKSGQYSTKSLLKKTKGKSLLFKLWKTWELLTAGQPQADVRLCLESNWAWDAEDGLGPYLQGHDNALKQEFFDADAVTGIGKLREEWRAGIGATPTDFALFLRCLRFNLGSFSVERWKEVITERMENLYLKHEDNDLRVATTIVQDFITVPSANEVTLEVLENKIMQHNLRQSPGAERYATVYLEAMKEKKLDLDPDYTLHWRHHFNETGRQLINPDAWNTVLLPELRTLEQNVSKDTETHLIRARGNARLSSWFAFGHTFKQVAGFDIEFFHQQRVMWRTDARPSTEFRMEIKSEEGEEGESLEKESDTVAVGISVSQGIGDEVKTYLQASTDASALLLLEPSCGTGECIQDNADLTAFVRDAKKLITQFVKKRKAKMLLLFYSGPASGACFLGHRLNAVCQEIQIMEYQQPGYVSSFLLTENNTR